MDVLIYGKVQSKLKKYSICRIPLLHAFISDLNIFQCYLEFTFETKSNCPCNED